MNKILFEGNKAFKSEELAGFITLKPTDPLSRAQLQQDVNIILSAYAQKGLYNAVGRSQRRLIRARGDVISVLRSPKA